MSSRMDKVFNTASLAVEQLAPEDRLKARIALTDAQQHYHGVTSSARGLLIQLAGFHTLLAASGNMPLLEAYEATVDTQAERLLQELTK